MFLKNLKFLIEKNGITKNKLLTDLKLGKNSFVNWEIRGTVPNGDTLLLIADYYTVTVDYLIGNTNDPRGTPENKLDVSDSMKQILEYLQNEQSNLTFDGELLDDDSRELLISSLESSLKLGKMISKRKEK